MKSTRFLLIIFLFTFLFTTTALADKTVYVPSSLGDVSNNDNTWSYSRSKQSDNWIVFWEAGYGTDPNSTSLPSSYRVDIDSLLAIAEKCFDYYADSLKFIQRGNSKTDLYKMIIRLRYTQEWEATGSGVDNKIGLLTLTAWSARVAGHTLAHEVGHCFQYQVHCDNNNMNGWMYGFGSNASGGNCWWEQCAQWQGFQIYKDQQFTDSNFSGYLNNAHKHILHETARYNNYFIQDYWTMLHGMGFIGRLWNESKSPEDPVEAYKRLTGISQSQFCDEMYDCAARFASWDIPALRPYGENKIDARKQPSFNKQNDGYWLIDSLSCPENYGYNIIRLNVPAAPSKVRTCFSGMAKSPGFRSLLYAYAEWRGGFVALLENGQRIYGDMHTIKYQNPNDTINFDVPAGCKRLWFVVSGGTKYHWLHAWDDNDANDEQWPYKVKFENTNLYGNFDYSDQDVAYSDTLTYNVTLQPFTGSTSSAYPSTAVYPDMAQVAQAFRLQLSDISTMYGSKIIYAAVNPNGALNYTSTANAPGHWFGKTGYTTNWGNSSYIFSEFNKTNFSFNIGQYPNVCKDGDAFTIKQALVYTPETGKTYRLTFVFQVTIAAASSINTHTSDESNTIVTYSSNKTLHVTNIPENTKLDISDLSGRIIIRKQMQESCFSEKLPSGIYIVSVYNSNHNFLRRKVVVGN